MRILELRIRCIGDTNTWLMSFQQFNHPMMHLLNIGFRDGDYCIRGFFSPNRI